MLTLLLLLLLLDASILKFCGGFLMKKVFALCVLVLLVAGFSGCDDGSEINGVDKPTEIDSTDVQSSQILSEEQLQQANELYNKYKSEGLLKEVSVETNRSGAVQTAEIEFIDEDAQAEFEDYLENEVGIIPEESNESNSVGLESDIKKSITIIAKAKRTWWPAYCRYNGYATAKGYTPSKIKATIRNYKGSSKNIFKNKSKTAYNKKSVSVETKEWAAIGIIFNVSAPERDYGSKAECWYDWGSGYLSVTTKGWK